MTNAAFWQEKQNDDERWKSEIMRGEYNVSSAV